MKVEGPKTVTEVEPTSAATERTPKAPSDKVTVGQAREVAEVIQATRSRATAGRAARLEQLEAAIQRGTFRPDVGRLAEQLLNAAEIDAKLRAMLQR
jgi:anti-sigma28 factor (negative regulator of flagellin synthesis)